MRIWFVFHEFRNLSEEWISLRIKFLLTKEANFERFENLVILSEMIEVEG